MRTADKETLFMPDQHLKPKKVDHPRLKELVREMLIALGEDPDREGLLETPRRIANFWKEFIEYDAGKLDTTFSSVRTSHAAILVRCFGRLYCRR